MKLTDTTTRTPVHGGENTKTPESPAKTFTEMTELERDIELLLMCASLSEITEALDERLQTLELTTTV